MKVIDRARAYLGGEPLLPVAVLFALNAVDEFDTALFGTLGPEIAEDFGVGVGIFGTITLLVTLLVPLVSVPVAHLADRHARMPLAIAGAAAWGAFSLATGLAPALWLLVVFRTGSGFGKVVNEPVHSSLLADFYSSKARVKTFGIHSLANPVGAAFAAVAGGAIAQVAGWRAAFFLALATFAVLLWARRLPEPPRGTFDDVEMSEAPPLAETVRRLWAIRSLRYQYIGLAFTAGSILGVSVLLPFFLKDEFGVEPGLRGLIIGIGTALSAAFVVIGTRWVQKPFADTPAASMRMLCRAGIVAGVCLLVVAVAPSLWLVVVPAWTIMCVFAFVTPGLRAIISTVAPPEIRASAFALAGLIALGGSGFAILGFAIGNSNVRLAVGLMAPIFLRGVAYFFKAAQYLEDDIARARRGDAASDGAGGGSRALLEVQGLTVSYDGVRVLFGVDLEVHEGEVIALLGTNGAGKSTTLNAISGLHEPDGGNVWFDGEPVVGLAPERMVRRGMVQVPGGRGVFPGLTVAENLEMGSFLLRRDRALVRARLDAVLALFPRLEERRHQKGGSLSGGERQMLTLAQSFLLRPRLLLIDELSLGLAPTVVQELLDAVRQLNAQGVSIVLVEQSVNVALTLADRAYFMEKGEVRFSGPTSELLARPDLLRSVFLEGAATRGRGTAP